MIQDVKVDVFYPHPPLRVWKALTDRSALAAWMMENDFEPQLGHKFRFQSDPHSGLETTIHCEVIEVDEPKRLVYTWQDSPTHKPCLVIWTLTPVEGGTQLHLEHQESRYTVAVGSIRNRSAQEQRSGGTVMFLYETVSSTPTLIAECHSPQLKSPTVYDELNHAAVFNTHPMDGWEYRLNQKLPEVLLHC
jgi:uncharacterized protein YndB with AHSA1/START domain